MKIRSSKTYRNQCKTSWRGGILTISMCAVLLSPWQTSQAVHEGEDGEPVHLFVDIAPGTFSDANEQISFDYVITNNSDDPIADIVVDHSLFGGAVCEVGLLSPTFSALCTADYFSTAADVAAGGIEGTVTVTSGDEVLETMTTSVPLGASDSLEVTATPETFGGPGQQITINYNVSNTSLQTLTGVEVVDPLVGGTVCSGVSLSPSVAVTCTQVYTTTVADVAAGVIVSSATAFSDQTDPVSLTSEIKLDFVSDSRFNVIPIPEFFTAIGETIVLDYRVENDTAADFVNIVVSDGRSGGTVCEAGLLSPEFTVICTAVYVTTEADVTAGEITGIATVTADGLTIPETTSYSIPLGE